MFDNAIPGTFRRRTTPEVVAEVGQRLRAIRAAAAGTPVGGHAGPVSVVAAGAAAGAESAPVRAPGKGVDEPPAVDDGIPDLEEPAPPRLSRRHVLAVAVVLLLGVVAAGAVLRAGRPAAEELAPSGASPIRAEESTEHSAAASTSVPAPPPGPEPAPTPTVWSVHVVGRVDRPGVVRVSPGSRVRDAVDAAGGAKAGVDYTTLNLARPVVDGEQIFVGVTPPPGAGPPAPGSMASGTTGHTPSTAPTEPLDLNTATVEDLQQLPGIGPVLAARIVDHRVEHGGFQAIDQLREVSGIGDIRYAELSPRVTVR